MKHPPIYVTALIAGAFFMATTSGHRQPELEVNPA
jgi:hypothetical protein